MIEEGVGGGEAMRCWDSDDCFQDSMPHLVLQLLVRSFVAVHRCSSAGGRWREAFRHRHPIISSSPHFSTSHPAREL